MELGSVAGAARQRAGFLGLCTKATSQLVEVCPRIGSTCSLLAASQQPCTLSWAPDLPLA